MTALSAASRRRLDTLADDWVEMVVRELANGTEIGDWRTDAKVPPQDNDEAYNYLMDRFSEWSVLVGTIIRTRRRSP